MRNDLFGWPDGRLAAMSQTVVPGLFDGLNEQQREAVTYGDGPLLILAGPGSGKTRVITNRVAFLVREQSVPPWRVLAVTFTNKAAREMRERAERLLGEDAADLHLGTFHSMCARWLRADGERVAVDRGFVIYDDADQLSLIKSIVEALRVDPRRFKPRAILSAISVAKNEMISSEEYGRRTSSYMEEIVARAYVRYQEALHNASALDFDDLLLEAARMLRDVPEALEKYGGRYKHVLIDEFQDTNPVQYLLARQLASVNGNICVVGDPDQSIYSWRSADSRNVQYFERDFPGCRVVVLEQNYRSTPAILEAADAVIAKNSDRWERRLRAERAGGELLTTYEAYNDEEEGEFVAREVQRLAVNGSRFGDAAVLYRTNAQSRPVEDALLRARIPYRLVGGIRFYQRREVKDVIGFLRLVQNPLDEASLLRLINVPTRGIGDRTVETVRGFAREHGVSTWEAVRTGAREEGIPGLGGRSRSALARFVSIMDGLEAARGASLSALLEQLLLDTGYLRHLSSVEDSGERLENIDQLRAVINQYEETGGEDSDLAYFLEGVALVADVDELGEEQPDAVTLITLHAAKGLEFPVVFLLGLEEGVLPHLRSFDVPVQMEEERRLAYVGKIGRASCRERV